ncbi:hypothetical protein E2C01_044017 [Portunus trituberculatus]|uniref:Uncharacterized protein n=1 Tax=Portunus trituberculatus TaxID=210409 RepID=A0A5B7G127_PORTR|nr:hypothetical protein [Portunus trituberculatus]
MDMTGGGVASLVQLPRGRAEGGMQETAMRSEDEGHSQCTSGKTLTTKIVLESNRELKQPVRRSVEVSSILEYEAESQITGEEHRISRTS